MPLLPLVLTPAYAGLSPPALEAGNHLIAKIEKFAEIYFLLACAACAQQERPAGAEEEHAERMACLKAACKLGTSCNTKSEQQQGCQRAGDCGRAACRGKANALQERAERGERRHQTAHTSKPTRHGLEKLICWQELPLRHDVVRRDTRWRQAVARVRERCSTASDHVGTEATSKSSKAKIPQQCRATEQAGEGTAAEGAAGREMQAHNVSGRCDQTKTWHKPVKRQQASHRRRQEPQSETAHAEKSN